MSKGKYIIAIDLGTTNCTMAYVLNDKSVISTDKSTKEIQRMSIPQVIAPGLQGENASLPSFIYFPLEEELEAKSVSVDWDLDREYCIGVHAKERLSEMPGRTIASAKSWLCHDGMDRRERFLPIDRDGKKMSPVEASAEYLKHLKESWDVINCDVPFVEQEIFITVPASFDPGARQLVQEAAELAEYPEIILLEEPQAAFYSWLNKYADVWRKEFRVGDNILVIDIGGGTTDFSLITVKDEHGNLQLERLAVGAHLLLGGDNMDLSLAYLAKKKLEDAGNIIDDWQFRQLVHSCCFAKEKLFGDHTLSHIDVVIHGRGSGLIGGMLEVKILKEEAYNLILNGFFPLESFKETSLSERRSGIRQVGLPYAQDSRISCQLAKFLSMRGESDNASLETFLMPTAVLFNGGVMKSETIRNRMLDVLNKWMKELGKEKAIRVLKGPEYDYGVSDGAAYYGLSRVYNAIRIKSGINRNYYVGVEDAVPAVPGMEPPLKALCVAPFGMEEGSEEKIREQEFSLVLGEKATFRFFSRSPSFSEVASEVGVIIKNWKKELKEIHPIETVLEQETDNEKTVKVRLKSKVTELGVLELWCVADDGREWKLEFDIRKEETSLV